MMNLELLQELIADPIDKWIVGGLILLLLAVLLVVRLIRRRRERHELEAIDIDLYSEAYFDDPPAIRQQRKRRKQQSLADQAPLLDEVIAHGIKPEEIEETQPTETADKTSPPKDLIVALYIKSPKPEGFKGTEIINAFEQVGLKYGQMKIFHHYGLENASHKTGMNKQAVFSVANIKEPGIFSLTEIERFYSPGLALFMCLPGPLSGRVAFELMLNQAYKLAEILKGVLEDETHHPLELSKISSLRAKIERFEREKQIEN